MRPLSPTRALVLAIVVSLISTADAQTTSCKAACRIDLEAGTCDEAVQTVGFSGQCCSLEEVSGTCFLVTTGRCRTELKGEPLWDCEYDDNGNVLGCDPNFMQYISASDAPCPPSEFAIPGFTNPPTPVPTVDDTDVATGYGQSEIIDGDPSQGDCYTVERHTFFTPMAGGCTETVSNYIYYTGGYNGQGQYTGWQKEAYLDIQVEAMHDCDSTIDRCTIQVSNDDGTQTTCDECLYEDQKVTMVDCSNVVGIFPAGVQKVSLEALLNPTAEIPYEEAFFTLAFDENKCLHPIYASNIPSTGPSIVYSSWPSYAATASPSTEATWAGTAYTEIIDGEIAQGDCYTVERYYQFNPWIDGCVKTDARYTYYVGGINGDGEDTNWPQEVYLEVEIEVFHDCDSTADQCTILVNTNDGVEMACDECSYENEKVTMVDCSSVGGAFASGSQTVSFEALFDFSQDVPYEEEFFRLAYDDEKCAHPIYMGTYIPSPVPGTPAPSSQATWAGTAYIDRIDGDPSQGDCYTIERLYSNYNQPTDGCVSTNARFTYYIGGINGDNEDTYYPREEYLKVEVEAFHDCDSTADWCTIQVGSTWSEQTACDECFYDNKRAVMVDCSNAAGLFPSGSQAISLEANFDSDQDVPYGGDFFSLAYDEEKCLHPIYAGVTTSPPTQAPAYTISPGVIASSASTEIYDGDVTLGDCYSVDRYWEYATLTNGCGRNYLRLVYYNGGMNADYMDTGYPKETYLTVVVNVPQRECPDPVANPDQCTISVGGQTCNACSVDGSLITMVDCSNVGNDIFANEIQTASLYWDATGIAYEHRFFRLAYDEEKCLHPALASTVPSTYPSFFSEIPTDSGPTFDPETFAPSYTGTEPPPTLGPWTDDWLPVPTVAPSYAGTEPPPTLGPWTDDWLPTTSPGVPSRFSCFSESSNGLVTDGTCHATDKDSCIEEWEDGCSEITAFFTYYNFAGPGTKEDYYYVRIIASSGCDPESNPDQPTNDCRVQHANTAVDCLQCFVDGDLVSLVDCTNLPEVFDPTQGQVISLSRAGDAFDVVQTEEMCSHPAVTLSSDSTPDNRGGIPKTLDKGGIPKQLEKPPLTLPVDVTLHFRFFQGKGGEPTKADVGMLATETIDFFDLVLMGNHQFGDEFLGIEMIDIESHYSTDTTPDEFSLTCTANVSFEGGASVSTRDAAMAMADANLSKYLHHYVRKNKSGHRNIFFQVKTVHFKGIGGHDE